MKVARDDFGSVHHGVVFRLAVGGEARVSDDGCKTNERLMAIYKYIMCVYSTQASTISLVTRFLLLTATFNA